MREASAPGNKQEPKLRTRSRKTGFATVQGPNLHSQDAMIYLALLNRVPHPLLDHHGNDTRGMLCGTCSTAATPSGLFCSREPAG